MASGGRRVCDLSIWGTSPRYALTSLRLHPTVPVRGQEFESSPTIRPHGAAIEKGAPSLRYAHHARNRVGDREDRSNSDIDLMVISDGLGYAELFAGLEDSAKRLGRAVNPTLYSRQEFAKRVRDKQGFASRVLAQPKIWIVGSDNDLST